MEIGGLEIGGPLCLDELIRSGREVRQEIYDEKYKPDLDEE